MLLDTPEPFRNPSFALQSGKDGPQDHARTEPHTPFGYITPNASVRLGTPEPSTGAMLLLLGFAGLGFAGLSGVTQECCVTHLNEAKQLGFTGPPPPSAGLFC